MIMASKNPFGKTVAKPYKENAHMVWTNDAGWTWYVLKTYQTPEREESNPNARWFCLVTSPFVPDGELGDVYVSEVKSSARRVDKPANSPTWATAAALAAEFGGDPSEWDI